MGRPCALAAACVASLFLLLISPFKPYCLAMLRLAFCTHVLNPGRALHLLGLPDMHATWLLLARRACRPAATLPPNLPAVAPLAMPSDLHVIIFDEIDAICKSRGSVRDGSGVHDTIVNQLLTKIDGVDALNNILLIGMTNRWAEGSVRPGHEPTMVR